MAVYNLFAALSDDDKEAIDEYISSFAPCDSDNTNFYNKKDLGTILREWDLEKQDLYKLLGEELIVRRLYSYKQTMEGLVNEFTLHKEDDAYRDFYSWWNWSVKHKAGINFELEGISQMSYYSKFFFIEEVFNFQNLAANSYQGEEFKVIFEDGSVLKVSRGMKPMKILHKFVEKYGTEKDEETFEEFRLWHSRLLNQKTIDGQLCLSIHPLDFMTMSDNANGWTSCMRWSDKWGHPDAGDYRTGTVECMNSPYIIIAYLHDPKHPMEFSGFKWDSKRWRELFIVNECCISEIKGYPYQDENLTNTCLAWIKELAMNNMGWTYDDEEYNMTSAISQNDKESIFIDFVKPAHMYKDFGSLKKHAGRINMDTLRDTHKFYHREVTRADGFKIHYFDIPYGGEATCMFCGKFIDNTEYDPGDNVVLCDDCETVRKCSCCGDALNNDDCYYIEEIDDYVCYNCYSEDCVVDGFDGMSHLADNTTEIRILLGYDSNENPVYHDDSAWVYEPKYNYSYRNIMNSEPKAIGWTKYVTVDMIIPHHERAFLDAFNIYPNKDIDSFYARCIEDYDLVYDWNHNLLYGDDEEEQ